MDPTISQTILEKWQISLQIYAMNQQVPQKVTSPEFQLLQLQHSQALQDSIRKHIWSQDNIKEWQVLLQKVFVARQDRIRHLTKEKRTQQLKDELLELSQEDVAEVIPAITSVDGAEIRNLIDADVGYFENEITDINRAVSELGDHAKHLQSPKLEQVHAQANRAKQRIHHRIVRLQNLYSLLGPQPEEDYEQFKVDVTLKVLMGPYHVPQTQLERLKTEHLKKLQHNLDSNLVYFNNHFLPTMDQIQKLEWQARTGSKESIREKLNEKKVLEGNWHLMERKNSYHTTMRHYIAEILKARGALD